MGLVEEFLLLGLRLARCEPRLLDAWTGDRRLRDQAAAGPVDPAELALRADELRDTLPSAKLAEVRTEHIAAQLTAISCRARLLAGAPVPYVEQVRACYQVQPRLADTDRYADAHRALARLLPGGGPVGERLIAHRRHASCPPERLPAAVAALTAALRERVAGAIRLDPAERVSFRFSPDRPWNGFACRTGDLATRVTLPADRPVWVGRLPQLVAHETYPGHHTEHCRQARSPAGRPELALRLVGTPLSVVSEGLAEQALTTAVGPGWGRWTAEVLAAVGIRVDGELVEQVAIAAAPLADVRADAALLLHDRHAAADDVRTHLRRWAFSTPGRTERVLAFLADPWWSGYVWAGAAGSPLVGRWLDRRPVGRSRLTRHAELLADPRTPDRLAADLAGAAEPDSPGGSDVGPGAGVPAARVGPGQSQPQP